MRETFRQARAALAGQPYAQRVLAVAAVTRLHVGGLTLVVLLLVEDVTGSLNTAGIAAGVLSLGIGAARPLQGRLMDRIGLRTLSMAAGIHLIVSVVTVARAGGASPVELFGLSLLLGLTTPAVSVATGSVWSGLVRATRQPALFGFDTALGDAAYFVGPLIAGAIAAAFDAQRALLALAAVALGGSWALARLASEPSPAGRKRSVGAAQRLRPVAPLLVALIGLGVVYGAVAVAAVAAVFEAGRDELSGPVTAALFAGGLAGDLLIAPRRPRASIEARLRVRLSILALATLCLPLAFAPVAVGAAALAVGATLAGAHVTVLLGIAARSTAGVRGEAFGWSGAAIRLGNAIGISAGGLAAGATSPTIAFLLATVGAVAALLAVNPRALMAGRLRRALRGSPVKRAASLGAVSAVVLLLAGCASTPAERAAAVNEDGSVPWVGKPAGLHEFDAAAPTPEPLDGAPPCRAEHLTARLDRWTPTGASDGAGTPTVADGPAGLIGFVDVENRSTIACTLSGLASARLVIADAPAPVVTESAASPEAERRVVPVRPGAHAQLRVDWSPPYCGPRGAQRLEVALPGGGGTLAAPVEEPSTPPCTRSEGSSGRGSVIAATVFDPPPNPPPEASRLDPVRVSLELPARPPAPGDALRFTVRLRNPTSRPISLAPCPGYLLERYATSTGPDPGLNDTRVYRLNCRPVDAIPARGSVLFEMKAAIPASGPGSRGMVLTWALLAPGLSNSGPGVGPNRVSVDVPVGR